MGDAPQTQEQLGPESRLNAEIVKLESQREPRMLIILAGAVLVLGALSLLVPGSFWRQGVLEMKIPPQVIFLGLIVFTVGAVYMQRREAEVEKLRLINLQQALTARSERSASMIDALTNVFNRNFLRDLLQGEIARAERTSRPLCLMMCDLNNFKQVNDKHGHLMGDYLLAQIAGILKSCVRGSDYVVRYGGDEFLVLLPETDDPGAHIVGTRILKKVAEWDRANRIGDLPTSVSLGLYQHVPGQSAEQDIAEVDTRMYTDKRERKSAITAAPAPRE